MLEAAVLGKVRSWWQIVKAHPVLCPGAIGGFFHHCPYNSVAKNLLGQLLIGGPNIFVRQAWVRGERTFLIFLGFCTNE